MKKLILIGLGFFQMSLAFSQNEFDALRYSQLDYYGDARFNAMGGSFGALGSNMAALSINPGGIGVYKSSDFSFTPSFHYNSSESNPPSGTASIDGKLNFHFSNVGIVGNFNASGGWKSVSFGLGYNRTSNYNSSITINSKTDSSALNSYTNQLNSFGGTQPDDIENMFPFSANMGYQSYLINPLTTDSMQYDNVFSNSKNITQYTTYQTRGGSGEMFFAFGGNYNDKLYLGILMGIPTVRYVYDKNYTESSDVADTLTQFKSYTISDHVKTTGTGLNLKLGLIYKVEDWFRIGAAFHTPTIYSLTDNYNTVINSEMKNGTTYNSSSPLGSFNYYVTTPYRFVTSASFIIGKYGAINGDYELVDYSSARLSQNNSLSSSGADFSLDNQNIRTNFQLTQNVRVGTEWRLDPFRIRAGYRYQGNPLNANFNANGSSNIYSIGFGIKQDGYYFDMAYSLKSYTTQTAIIEDQGQFAAVNQNEHYVSFTLGFRF